MQPTPVTCKSCGTVFEGKYCSVCGEKVYEEHDKKISHFFEEAFHFITHFDNKIFRSFWLMLTKPGFVPKEYCEGKRKSYFSPISLFMVGVVIYLLFPLLQGMNISFANHLNNNNFLHFYALENWAVHKANAEHISLDALAEKFDHLSPKFSKVLLVVLIPLTALNLAILFRKKRKYYFDHLIMAAEFNSFYLYFFFMILPLIVILLSKLPGINLDAGDSVFFFSLQGAITLLWIGAALRRFYQAKYITILWKGLLFVVMYLIMLSVYRLILFSAVMLFI